MMDDREDRPADERRQASRAHMNFRISIRERGRIRQSATIQNLTPFGCAVTDLFLVAKQQTVWIKLPGIESQPAKLQWANEESAGFTFDRPLHPLVVARFVDPIASDGRARPQPSASSLHEAGVSTSRKDQILAGWADPSERLLAKKRPLPNGKNLLGLIKRRTTRVADHRRERRYAPPTDAAGSVRIAEDHAKVLNLSSSGLQVELAKRVEIGSSLPVTFAGFAALSGHVVWAGCHQVGLALPANSIDLREVSHGESNHQTMD